MRTDTDIKLTGTQVLIEALGELDAE